MQEEDCYWSNMEIKAVPNTNKTVAFKGVKSFLDYHAANPVYSL